MMVNLGAGAGLSDEEIRSIETPVLIGIGDLDQMVSIDESKRVADLLPNASLKIYEGFPHPIDRVDVVVLKAALL
jgi:pimeloyl-ACP methyl ester carboxylesterase